MATDMYQHAGVPEEEQPGVPGNQPDEELAAGMPAEDGAQLAPMMDGSQQQDHQGLPIPSLAGVGAGVSGLAPGVPQLMINNQYDKVDDAASGGPGTPGAYATPGAYDPRYAEYAASVHSMQADQYSLSPTQGRGGHSDRDSYGKSGAKGTVEESIAQRRLKNRQSAALSRQRKKEYINNLEKTTTCLTTEKLELQLKVATLTNQTWEQKLKIEEFEKQIAELRAEREEWIKTHGDLGLALGMHPGMKPDGEVGVQEGEILSQ
eukprot:TRINITY_DN2315_c0_g1_i1.p1 TRINITY_DN2315_c0_g1~~TRINITY_DN2315_c0_g1_i1.p1  ORF type:complete len:301 (-),score=94.24 TRINITY_DN2315_c0_g1_i1:83-871(-)